jgi:hypothetical protein
MAMVTVPRADRGAILASPRPRPLALGCVVPT